MDTINESILKFIKDYFLEHCYAPTNEEIAHGVYISMHTAQRHVAELFEKGELITDLKVRRGSARAYRPKGFKCIDGGDGQ